MKRFVFFLAIFSCVLGLRLPPRFSQTNGRQQRSEQNIVSKQVRDFGMVLVVSAALLGGVMDATAYDDAPTVDTGTTMLIAGRSGGRGGGRVSSGGYRARSSGGYGGARRVGGYGGAGVMPIPVGVPVGGFGYGYSPFGFGGGVGNFATGYALGGGFSRPTVISGGGNQQVLMEQQGEIEREKIQLEAEKTKVKDLEERLEKLENK